MKISTSSRFEEIGPDRGRIVVRLTVDGVYCGEIAIASGPLEDVKAYFDGEIGFEALYKALHGTKAQYTWRQYDYCPSCASRNVRGEECPDCHNHLPPWPGEPGYGRIA